MGEPPPLSERLSVFSEELVVAFQPRRWRRGARTAVKVLAVLTISLASTTGGLVLHLNTTSGRGAAREIANVALGSIFQGRIEVGTIEDLSLEHAKIETARIVDPNGDEIISARGIEASVGTIALLRAVFIEDDAIAVVLPHAHIESATVSLRPDAEGIPTIATTFLPRDPSPSTPGGRPVLIDIPDITITSATVSSSLGVPFEATANDVIGSVFVRTDRLLAVDVPYARVHVQDLPPAEIVGDADYHLRVDLREYDDAAWGPWSVRRKRDSIVMWASVEGGVGGMPASATGVLDGLYLHATGSLPQLTPEGVMAVFPGFPLHAPASAVLAVQGDLPASLSFRGIVGVGTGPTPARVVVDGGLSVSEGIRLTLGLDGTDIDPRAFLPSAPDARLDARAKLMVAVEPGETDPQLTAEIATQPTEAFGQAIPAVDAVVHLHRGEVLATGTIHEPGIPIDAQVSFVDDRVAFSADVVSESLLDAPRLEESMRGAVRARVDGSFAEGQLSAKLSANGIGVGTAPKVGTVANADHVTVVASLTGPLGDLQIHGRASGSGVSAAGERLDTVRLGVDGSILEPHVDVRVDDAERGTLQAGAKVVLLEQAARDVTFRVEREGESIRGAIAAVELGRGVSIRGLNVTEGSIGNLAGSVSFEGDEIVGTLRAERLDLARVQKLFALPIPMAGIANIDVNVARSGRGRRGTLELEVIGGKLLFLDGVSSRISARFDGDAVEAAGFVRLVDEATPKEREDFLAVRSGIATGDDEKRVSRAIVGDTIEREIDERELVLCHGPVAEVRFANVKGELQGPLLSADTWTSAVGSADIAADHVNLGCLERRIPAFLRPVERARGLVSARFRIARKEEDPHPTIEGLFASTVGLVLIGKEGAWESKRLDVALKGSFDGSNGKTAANGAVYEHGSSDVVAWLSGAVDLDPSALLRGGDARTRAFLTAPVEVSVEVPSRRFAGFAVLPEPVASLIPVMDGVIGAQLHWTGSVERPSLSTFVEATGLLPEGVAASGTWAPAIDVSLEGHYDPDKAAAKLSLKASAEKTTLVDATANVALAPHAIFLAPKDKPLPWSGSLEAQIEALPFESIPTLAERGLAGTLRGRVVLEGLNIDPWASIDLASADLRIQGVPTPVEIGATIDETGEANFTTRVLDDGARETLYAEGIAQTPWLNKTIPVLDPTRPGELKVTARGFRLAALYPLVAGTLSKLDGVLTGRMNAHWDDLTKPLSASIAFGWPTCSGSEEGEPVDAVLGRCPDGYELEYADPEIHLAEVVAYIPQLGQELHEGQATIVALPRADGTQRLLVRDFSVQGSTGRLTGGEDDPDAPPVPGQRPDRQLFADLKGLALVAAGGTLVVPEGEEIPITIEGVSFGKTSARVDFDLVPDTGRIATRATVYDAKFELPASSSRNVQSLEAAKGIQVNALLGPPVETRSGEATRWEFGVTLRPTKVQSSALEVTLVSEGELSLVLADRLYAAGDIQLVEGSVVVNKKKFEIDQGLIRLRDAEPGNPYVNLTAHWDAGADLRVYVDYQGLLSPITDDKIRFRADPPLTQDEIVQMLLFGQGSATAGNLVGTLGGSVATGFANDLLSSAMGGFFRDVTVSVGTSDTESSVGASWGSDRLTVGGNLRQLTESTDSSVENSRSGNCGDLFVEWRLSDRWSLRGSSGYCGYDDESANEGGPEDGVSVGVDALWQFRY